MLINMELSKEEFINSFREPKLHGNVILDLNPFTKLNLALVGFLAAALIGDYYPRLIAIIICYIVTFVAGKDVFKKYTVSFHVVAGFIFFFIILANFAFREGETVYAEWWLLTFTKEGFLYGLKMALLITEVCACVMTFYVTTPMKDIMYSFEMLGMSRSASYTMLASMQSVIDLGKSTNTIMESQSARGVETTGKLTTRAKAFIPILFPLLLSAIAATEEKTIAMETRAFSSNLPSTHMYELRKTPIGEKLFCFLFDVVMIAWAVWSKVR